ncbi:MAG: UDP-N-acetylmuramoyl-tripeptide--D-alanyl-D-alanine ligase [Lachnospiraceae bacterium]|nr:UDP-N-acetylmuramoyl-tripeptide--D-alanyl-D-alanine ligase [Lachnospiraceae bacterium]
MKNMTLKNIASAVNGELVASAEQGDMLISGVQLDSRKIEEGNLFIATVGERVDGHDFIGQVYEKGAIAVVCEKRPSDDSKPYILVESSFTALEKMAEFYRKQLKCKIVAITGSVGKTSTKETVAAVLEQKYNVFKTSGNFNSNIGLPLMVLSIREEHEAAVLEMGISHFDEMVRMSRAARPDIAIITNIGTSHMENLGSQEGILEEKSHIFDFLPNDGIGVVNGDDPLLSKLGNAKGHKIYRFGFGDKNDIIIKNYEPCGLHGSNFRLISKAVGGKKIDAHINLPGNHMALNAACAALVASKMGISEKLIAEGIDKVRPMSGRSNIVSTDNFTIIDDCYNANPASMKAAIDLLAIADGRKICILGDMFELGETEEALHEEVGRYCAKIDPDAVVCIGNLSQNIFNGAQEAGIADVFHFDTKDDFFKVMGRILEKGDSILVKASHGMHFEEIVNKLKEIEL